MIARPAGMLLWHRLRIITGMPRMAVANPEPRQAMPSSGAGRLGAPRFLELDSRLARDPFAESLPNLPEDASDQDKAMMMEICQLYDIIPRNFDSDHLITANSSKVEKKELLTKMIAMYTDAYFKVGTLDTAQIVAEKQVPVFQYR